VRKYSNENEFLFRLQGLFDANKTHFHNQGFTMKIHFETEAEGNLAILLEHIFNGFKFLKSSKNFACN